MNVVRETCFSLPTGMYLGSHIQVPRYINNNTNIYFKKYIGPAGVRSRGYTTASVEAATPRRLAKKIPVTHAGQTDTFVLFYFSPKRHAGVVR